MATPIPYFRAEKIADGSWMIKNAFVENSYSICYLIEGKDYALLIDSIIGLGNLKSFCETLTDKTVRLVNTHAHSDHYGGNFHFNHCWLHHKDIAFFQTGLGVKKEQLVDMAKEMALPEYRDLIEPDDNFRDWKPMRVFPLYGGDVFDLGDRQIEVVEVGGHTPGSVVLIDHKTRIAYTGDACNGNTLLEFPNCLPVAEYMKSLLRLKEHQGEFDMMYGGHEVFDASLVDEAIETVARVIAGTDDRCERTGLMGGTVYYAAEKVKDGYERVDGKHFNMSYVPDRITAPEQPHHVIGTEEDPSGLPD